MTKKKEEPIGPTKAKIEYLLRHSCFTSRCEDSEDPNYKKWQDLAKEHSRRTEEFQNSREMKRLQDHIDHHREEYTKRRDANGERLTKIRREFYAKGMTPKVLKDIGKFVDDINGEGK